MRHTERCFLSKFSDLMSYLRAENVALNWDSLRLLISAFPDATVMLF